MPFPILHRVRGWMSPVLGVLATLGFAPYGQWYLTLPALALLFSLLARTPPGRAALLGWLFGFAHFGTGVYWVYISTHVYGGAPVWLGVALALALSAGLAAFYAVFSSVCTALDLFRRPVGWAAVPAVWVLLELIRGRYFFDGFPWLSLGELLLNTPLARLAPVLGVHGISAVVVLLAYALFRIGVEPDTRRRVWAGAVLLTPALTLLLPKPSEWTKPEGNPMTVALVQSDIRQDEKWLPSMRYEALVRHWRLTQQAWPADLVVWPEVALTQPYHQLREGFLADLDKQAAARNATVLLGILVADGDRHYNSVVAVGAAQGRYDKRHLVPFGEYFPIPGFLRPLMDVLGTPYEDFSVGAAQQVPLTAGGRRLAVSICFEDVFGDDVRRDARTAAYLVNVTNDAWFGRSSAPHQHLQFSRLRAMENGRWMARVANTGISALIDPDGKVVMRTSQFAQQVLRGTVQPRRGLTPYQRWGDAPLWGGSLVLLLILLLRFYPRRTSA
ncbi:MAG: apolipoprotein N-acyltransferase [Nevskiales bacterium]|nr:apolipoprotein N-acyltransferase [Nevskiales bacterium]